MIVKPESLGSETGRAHVVNADASRVPSVCTQEVIRTRLINALLENRSVLRCLCAPAGFGRTTLLRQYARTVSPDGRFMLLDATSPAFLLLLDDVTSGKADMDGFVGSADVFIFDDVSLDEDTRLDAFSHLIDYLLAAGKEVLMSCVPSAAVIQGVQPGALTLFASDLLVDSSERFARTPGEGAVILRSPSYPADHDIASLVWGGSPDAAVELYRSFFSEKLPQEFFALASCLVLLGSGTMAEAQALSYITHEDVVDYLREHYPFLGIDPLDGTFSCVPISSSDCLLSQSRGGLPRLLDEERYAALAATLAARGELERSLSFVLCFCSQPQLVDWLLRFGYEALDRGLSKELRHALASCPDRDAQTDQRLSLLAAWAMYCGGDFEGAFHRLNALRALEDPAVAPSCFCLGTLLSSALSKPSDRFSHALEGGSWNDTTRPLIVEPENPWYLPIEALKFREEAIREDEESRRASFLGVLMRCLSEAPETFSLLSLHLVVSETLDTPDSLDLRLAGALARAAYAVVDRGVATISQALIVVDAARASILDISGRADLGGGLSAFRQASVLLESFAPCPDLAPLEALSSTPSNGTPVVLRAHTSERLRVNLFGAFEVLLDGRPLDEPALKKSKVRALFMLLLLGKGKEISRDRIYSELWPHFDCHRARENYYVTWSALKRAFSRHGLDSLFVANGEHSCSIRGESVSSDIDDFNTLIKHITTEDQSDEQRLSCFYEIDRLYNGDLLLGDCESDFIDASRAWYREIYIDAMVRASSEKAEVGDGTTALWFARRAFEYGVDRDDAYAALMRAQVLNGQRSGAAQTYHRCKTTLLDTLGISPSETTQGIYDGLFPSPVYR